jgi:hypothetical protein
MSCMYRSLPLGDTLRIGLPLRSGKFLLLDHGGLTRSRVLGVFAGEVHVHGGRELLDRFVELCAAARKNAECGDNELVLDDDGEGQVQASGQCGCTDYLRED